jgi:hypothetical protein
MHAAAAPAGSVKPDGPVVPVDQLFLDPFEYVFVGTLPGARRAQRTAAAERSSLVPARKSMRINT